MTSRRVRGPVMAVAAVIAWCGILLQAALSIGTALSNGHSIGWGLMIYFGYFTVITNIVVGVALIAPLLAPRSAAGRWSVRPVVVAGIAANIAFVGLAYHVLLRKIWSPQGLHWLADILLHYVTPMVFLSYWFVCARDGSLRLRDVPWWGAYPALYFIYALARGEVVGLYPYGFIDASVLGYPRAIANGLGLLLVVMILGTMLVALDRVRPLKLDAMSASR